MGGAHCLTPVHGDSWSEAASLQVYAECGLRASCEHSDDVECENKDRIWGTRKSTISQECTAHTNMIHDEPAVRSPPDCGLSPLFGVCDGTGQAGGTREPDGSAGSEGEGRREEGMWVVEAGCTRWPRAGRGRERGESRGRAGWVR